MHPILVTSAASAAGDIIQNIAERFAQRPAKTDASAAPAVPFATLIERASAPTAAQQARHAQDLSTRLGQSAEFAAAANEAGASVPFQVQIDASGATALRLPDGGLKAIPLSEEMRAVARELHQLRHSAATAATLARPGGAVSVAIG